jgi:CheY-like chemotaxis protein
VLTGTSGTRRERLIMSVRVLIVDDSAMVRDGLRHHLQCIGCEVVAEAGDTLQALALFRTVSPSLVILDIAVPQTGGIGVGFASHNAQRGTYRSGADDRAAGITGGAEIVPARRRHRLPD